MNLKELLVCVSGHTMHKDVTSTTEWGGDRDVQEFVCY